MDVLFEAHFEKDLRKIRDKTIRQRLKNLIMATKEVSDISDIGQIRKLKGYETYYRIRIGDYRAGIEIIDDTVIFTRFLHRKDIYKYFP